MSMHDLHAIIDPFQIMVVNRKGVLRKVRCPFRVLCISPVESIKDNSFCYVQRVSGEQGNKIYYLIEGKYYPHWHFRIYVSF